MASQPELSGQEILEMTILTGGHIINALRYATITS
jgi:hypothetical protein